MHHEWPAPDAPRAQLRCVAEHYSTALQRKMYALAAHLSDPAVGQLVAVLGSLEDELTNQIGAEEHERWQRILAHCPGFAPMLDLVATHVAGSAPACEPPGSECTLGLPSACTLRQEVE